MHKDILKKTLAVSALAGTALLLMTKLIKNKRTQNPCGDEPCCDGDDDEFRSFEQDSENAGRNYVPLSRRPETEEETAEG